MRVTDHARFAALTLAVVLACAATEESKPSHGSGATGSGADAGEGTLDLGGKGGSKGSVAGTLNVGDVTGAGAESSVVGGAACAGEVTQGELIPLDVHIMLDTSLSMLESTGPGMDKWKAVKQALAAFLNDEGSAGIGVGIQYFPLAAPGVPESCTSSTECGAAGPCNLKFCALNPNVVYCTGNGSCGPTGPCINVAYCSKNELYVCNNPNTACGDDEHGNDLGTCTTAAAGTCDQSSSCDIADYSVPAEPIQALPDGAEAILDSINARDPAGNTPTAAALSGALSYASDWATEHPGHTVVTLLATDGFPTQCAPTDFPTIADLAQTALEASPSISTYVIGVFAPGTAMAQENLDTIAVAGGTEQAFIIDTSQDVAAQFLEALNAIRGTKLACEFQVPQAPAGEMLDYDGNVNVQFTLEDNTELLPYVESADECGITQGGWYYDLNPADGETPTKILVCPSTCEAFQGAVGGQVEIELGCETRRVVVK